MRSMYSIQETHGTGSIAHLDTISE